jgi:hypothetical protein
MAALADCYRWWRYPVKGPTEINLDHRGKVKALYPVRRFSAAECRAYEIEEWRGQYEIRPHETFGGDEIRGWPGLQHKGTKAHRVRGRLVEMEPYRRRLDPGLRYLSPSQKATAEAVWQPWGWQTSGYATERITGVDKWNCRTLIGYGDRAEIVTGKTFTYERPLIRTRKPKANTFWRDGIRRRCRLSGGFGEAEIGPSGTWTFLGHGRPYTDRWHFTPARRKPRRVRPSFKEGWRPDRRWKPDRDFYFGTWEQVRYVHWTRLPIPSGADLRAFLTQKRFLLHRVGDN